VLGGRRWRGSFYPALWRPRTLAQIMRRAVAA
jgi:hypothetical protein